MRTTSRTLIAIGCVAALAAALAACAGSAPAAQQTPHPEGTTSLGPTATTLPYVVRATKPPRIVHVDVPGAPAIVAGPAPGMHTTPPSDPDGLARAKQWIVAATPPPGVRVLAAAPSPAPTHPSQLVACDWLVRATRWWATDAGDAAAAETWLGAHPVDGLAVTGTMKDSSGRVAITESPQSGEEGFLSFEFVPASDGRPITIAVDAVIVPKGAECMSTGVAGSMPAAPR